MCTSRSCRSSGRAKVVFLILPIFFLCITAVAQTRLGDLDADGQPTVLDLVTLINHISGTRPLSGELQPFGDINEDGVIDQADVDFLADAVLGAVALPNPFSAPLVSVPVTATNGTNILITGTSRPNRTIVVNGGMRAVTTTADSNGNFSLNVPLQANKLNVLFVSATNSAFVSGTPQPLRIIQDS